MDGAASHFITEPAEDLGQLRPSGTLNVDGVLSVDSANKASETSDYTVATVWGISNERYYLLHVTRQRVEFHDLLNVVEEVATRFAVTDILMEDRASGTQLIQELTRKGRWNVIPCSPVGDKVMRFAGIAPVIRAQLVSLPSDAAWVDEYLRELCSFPNTQYTDQVDATSQFLAWAREARSTAATWIAFNRQSKEENDVAQGFTEKLRAPDDYLQAEVRTRSGRQIPIFSDRIIAVGPADAEALIAAGWTRV